MKEVPLIITLHAAVLGTFIWLARRSVLTAVRITKPVRILRNRFREGSDAEKFHGEQTCRGIPPDPTRRNTTAASLPAETVP
jgi:hypothetical protein